MQDSTSFLFNVTSWLVSSASQGSGDYFPSVFTPTHSTTISDRMSFVSSTVTSEQLASVSSIITSEPMKSVPSTITSVQITFVPSSIISEQMPSLPSTSEPISSVPSTITSAETTFAPSPVTSEQRTSVPSTVSSSQITSKPSTIISKQMTSLTSVISNQLTSSGSLAATQLLSSPSLYSSQVAPYTELVTSFTSQPSTTLMPSVVNSTVIETSHQYSSTLSPILNESVHTTQTLAPSGNTTVLSSTPSSISFQVEPTSLSSNNYSSLQTSSSTFQTSFLEPTSYSNVTSTEFGSYSSEFMTQPLRTSMMQTETYVSEGVTKSLTEVNTTLTSNLSTPKFSNVFPTRTEAYSSVNDTDTLNTYNSTIELSQISQTLVESTSSLDSLYNESTSTYYQDINATESFYYESSTTDFFNVTEGMTYENTTDGTDFWNTTEAETTTLNTTILITLETTTTTSTVTTTAKTTTRATTVSSTTKVPIGEYSLTVPVIIGITVGLVVLTALIFVMLLWRRKVKQDHSVNVPRRYSVNSTKSRSFKHQSLYGRHSGEHHHPHFAPVYYGETDQVDERKPVRMSNYKIKDTNTQVGRVDDVELRPKEPISRVDQLRQDITNERHSFPYEKRRLHFYSQYGKGPNNIDHSFTLKGITNGNVNTLKVNGTTEIDKPKYIQMNGTGEGGKPEYIKMNGVYDNHSEDNGSTKPHIENTKL